MSKLQHQMLGDLLNRTYELEGLLLLALSRQEYDRKIQTLITSKIFSLADTAAEWDPEGLDEYRNATPASVEDSEDSSYSLEDDEEIGLADNMTSCSPQKCENINDAAENVVEEVMAAQSIESVVARAGMETQPASVEIDFSQPSEEEEEKVMEGLPAEEKFAEVSFGLVEETTPVDMPVEEQREVEVEATIPPVHEELIAEVTSPEETAPVSQAEEKSAPQPRPVVGLNDRYLFTRTLFHNSRKEFDNCLNLIARMENYDEAEDYLLNELELNPDDNEAKQFMDIIRRYFDAL